MIKRFTTLVTAIVLLAYQTTAQTLVTGITAKFDTYERVFEAEHGMTIAEAVEIHASGASVVLISDCAAEQRVYGARNEFTGNPTNFNTIYRMGSISKMFAGLAMARAHPLGHYQKTKGKMLSAGSTFILPAGHAHYMWNEEEVIALLTATGPWNLNYVNPADDPRHQ